MLVKELDSTNDQEVKTYLSKAPFLIVRGFFLIVGLLLSIPPILFPLVRSFIYEVSFLELIVQSFFAASVSAVVGGSFYYFLLIHFLKPFLSTVEKAVRNSHLVSESELEDLHHSMSRLSLSLVIWNLVVFVSGFSFFCLTEGSSPNSINLARMLFCMFLIIAVSDIQIRYLRSKMVPVFSLLPIFSVRDTETQKTKLRSHVSILLRMAFVAIPVTFILYCSLEILNVSNAQADEIKSLLTLPEASIQFALNNERMINKMDVPTLMQTEDLPNKLMLLVQRERYSTIANFLYTIYFIFLLVNYAFQVYMQRLDDQRLLRIKKKYYNLTMGDVKPNDLAGYKVPIDYIDPLGELTSQYNDFISKQVTAFNQLRDTSDVVVESFDHLEETVNKTNRLFLEVQAESLQKTHASEQKNQQIQRVMLELKETFKIFMTLGEKLEKQFDSTQQVFDLVQNLSSETKTINDLSQRSQSTAKHLQTVAQEGMRFTEQSINAIQDVKTSSSEVNEEISLISNISSKTNMLAINAAIESAHAGEAGKGFSVVSEEVRSLANSTSIRATQIKKNMNEMIGVVNESVTISENISGHLEQIIKDIQNSAKDINSIVNASDSQEKNIQLLNDNIRFLVGLTNSLHEISTSRVNANKQIEDELNETNQSLDFIEKSIGGQIENIRKLGLQIEDLKQTAKEGKAMSEELRSLF